MAQWPDWESLNRCVRTSDYSGDEFGDVRKKFARVSEADLETLPEDHALLVWQFLLGTAAAPRANTRAKNIAVIVNRLSQHPRWCIAFQSLNPTIDTKSPELQEAFRKCMPCAPTAELLAPGDTCRPSAPDPAKLHQPTTIQWPDWDLLEKRVSESDYSGFEFDVLRKEINKAKPGELEVLAARQIQLVWQFLVGATEDAKGKSRSRLIISIVNKLSSIPSWCHCYEDCHALHAQVGALRADVRAVQDAFRKCIEEEESAEQQKEIEKEEKAKETQMLQEAGDEEVNKDGEAVKADRPKVSSSSGSLLCEDAGFSARAVEVRPQGHDAGRPIPEACPSSDGATDSVDAGSSAGTMEVRCDRTASCDLGRPTEGPSGATPEEGSSSADFEADLQMAKSKLQRQLQQLPSILQELPTIQKEAESLSEEEVMHDAIEITPETSGPTLKLASGVCQGLPCPESPGPSTAPQFSSKLACMHLVDQACAVDSIAVGTEMPAVESKTSRLGSWLSNLRWPQRNPPTSQSTQPHSTSEMDLIKENQALNQKLREAMELCRMQQLQISREEQCLHGAMSRDADASEQVQKLTHLNVQMQEDNHVLSDRLSTEVATAALAQAELQEKISSSHQALTEMTQKYEGQGLLREAVGAQLQQSLRQNSLLQEEVLESRKEQDNLVQELQAAKVELENLRQETAALRVERSIADADNKCLKQQLQNREAQCAALTSNLEEARRQIGQPSPSTSPTHCSHRALMSGLSSPFTPQTTTTSGLSPSSKAQRVSLGGKRSVEVPVEVLRP